MLNLIPILFLLLLVAVLVWPTRKGAQMVGAVQTSYPMAIVAILAGTLLSILITAPLSLLFALATRTQPPGILFLLLAVLASAVAYAKILETSFFGGITIYLLQTACWLAFSGIVYLGVTAWAPEAMTARGVSDLRTAPLRAASDAVCDCGADGQCLSDRYRQLRKIAEDYEGALLLSVEKQNVAEYTQRAKVCAMQPSTRPSQEPPAAAPAS